MNEFAALEHSATSEEQTQSMALDCLSNPDALPDYLEHELPDDWEFQGIA